MTERVTKDTILTMQDIKDIANQWVKFLKTKDIEKWIDILAKLKLFVQKDSGIILSDWVKIWIKNIEHVMDCHWYDTELWLWTSVTIEDFLKIPDILEKYDNIENSDTQDYFWNITHIRYLLQKYYWPDTYNLIIEIQDNTKVQNQIWMITLYINDVVTESKFVKEKALWNIDKLREKAIKEFWKIRLDF